MSVDEDLFGALSRAALEAGRLVRGAAEEAAKELSGAFGKDQMRWPLGLLGPGPIIPSPYKIAGQGFTWQDGYMVSCAFSVFRAFQQYGAQPATAALLAVQGALQARPEGYRLLQVGLNAHRVLRHGEWDRCFTSVLLHSDLPHLVSNATGLVIEGLPLEKRLGTLKFAGLVVSTAALTQALYVAVTRLAVEWVPRSKLADDYYITYSVGFSGVALALKVVAGYMREADLAVAGVVASEEFLLTAGRLAAWPTLLMSHYIVPNANLPAHLCGLAAGVIHVYGSRLLSWLWRRLRRGRGQQRRIMAGGRLAPAPPSLLDLGSARHPGLGWLDLATHLVLGAGTCLMAHMAKRSKA